MAAILISLSPRISNRRLPIGQEIFSGNLGIKQVSEVAKQEHIVTASPPRSHPESMSSSHTASASTLSDVTVTNSRPTSLLLPRRSPPPGKAKASPVWAISSPTPEVSTPLPAKCGRHQDGRRGFCCKDLKKEERHLINTDILRDV